MGRRLAVAFLMSSVALFAPGAALAQSNLSELLPTLIQAGIELAPPPAGVVVSHAAHFEPGTNQKLAPVLFNQEIIAQLANFPLGSSSGGFAYTFDAASGTFKRSASTFGPAFAERALTNGKGKLNIGGNFQYSSYGSFEGTSLDNGDVKFFLRHQPTGANPPFFFEFDLVEADLNLKLSTSTTTFFANYGINDQWDVAIAVPLVHVAMDATVNATVRPFGTGDLSIHHFPDGGATKSFATSGTASGVGDILLRTKYRFLSTPNGGLAAGLDLRLPSGDAKNLLGTGAVQVTGTLIGSTTMDKFAPHFNVSVSKSGDGEVVSIPTEIDYKFGTEYALQPTVTLNVDFLGRSLLDAGRLEARDVTYNFTKQDGSQSSTSLHEYQQVSGALNLANLALGGKFNVKDNLLVSANVLIALTSSGITARVTPVVGVDFSF